MRTVQANLTRLGKTDKYTEWLAHVACDYRFLGISLANEFAQLRTSSPAGM